MNRSIESLARAYQDQTLCNDEVRKLDQLLRTDAEAREVFLLETNLIAAIEDIACYEAIDEPSATSPAQHVNAEDGSWAQPWRVTMVAGWVVAAVAALLLMASLLSSPAPEKNSIATIVGLSGPLQWTGDGGQVRSDLNIGMKLPGGTIDGLSPESWFSLEFDDGSTVITSGNSMVAFSDAGQKILHLKAGNLSADVTPQPAGRPMLIHTRSAVLEVVGTSFEVDVDLAATALNVTEGKVRVRRLSDGSQVEVSARHQVIAAADQDLSVNRVPEVSRGWRSRLEDGPRRTYGRWLPATDDTGPLLHCIPHTTEHQRTIYTSAFQVTAADAAPVMTSDRTIVRVQGRLERATDLFVGLTLKTKEGEFAGRFQLILSEKSFRADDEFEFALPIAGFKLDPSLETMKSRLAKSASDFVVDSLWCHTLYQPAGLAVASVELMEKTQ
jgi:ferric-dicitrate binding protein FerR (iron transport regulator)